MSLCGFDPASVAAATGVSGDPALSEGEEGRGVELGFLEPHHCRTHSSERSLPISVVMKNVCIAY